MHSATTGGKVSAKPITPQPAFSVWRLSAPRQSAPSTPALASIVPPPSHAPWSVNGVANRVTVAVTNADRGPKHSAINAVTVG